MLVHNDEKHEKEEKEGENKKGAPGDANFSFLMNGFFAYGSRRVRPSYANWKPSGSRLLALSINPILWVVWVR